MRNRTSLALMELVVLFFVFAFASAWCLKGFVWADQQSEQQYQREQAMWQTQSVAEILKGCKGDFSEAAELLGGSVSEDILVLNLNKNWERTEENPEYTLQAMRLEDDLDLLGQAVIEVRDDTQVLATITVGWQEVDRDE